MRSCRRTKRVVIIVIVTISRKATLAGISRLLIHPTPRSRQPYNVRFAHEALPQERLLIANTDSTKNGYRRLFLRQDSSGTCWPASEIGQFSPALPSRFDLVWFWSFGVCQKLTSSPGIVLLSRLSQDDGVILFLQLRRQNQRRSRLRRDSQRSSQDSGQWKLSKKLLLCRLWFVFLSIHKLWMFGTKGQIFWWML